ncbi:acyltransferase [soil metagenome]
MCGAVRLTSISPAIYPLINVGRVVLKPRQAAAATDSRQPRTFARKLLHVTDSKRRLDWLQVLRGVAALGVVMSHCAVYLVVDANTRWLTGALDHLGSGVDLFFIISGFIMVHTTMNDTGGLRSAVRFVAKRMQRIWPAYIVLTLVFGFAEYGWRLIGDDATRLMLVKSLLFVPGSYDTIFANQVIGPGWTLGFEMYFYAVFAVSLLFVRWRWLFLAIWCVVMLLVVPLAYGASLTGVFESWETAYPVGYLKLATNPFVWEFVFGGLAAVVHHSRLRIGSVWTCWALASVAVMFAVWNTLAPILPGTFGLAAGYVLLIVALSVASKSIALPALRPLRYCGDISYTLYLAHTAVIHGLHWVYHAAGLNAFSATWFNVAISLAGSIAFAALTSRFLERDMLKVLVSVCRTAWAEPAQRCETGADAIVPQGVATPALGYRPAAPR